MSVPEGFQWIAVRDLVLDVDNPRFFHLRQQEGQRLSQDDIEKEILDTDEDLPLLIKTIQKSGIKDPIWVVKGDGGKYIVVEGNRRTVVLKKLLKEGAEAPPGIKFDSVLAHVLPEDSPPAEIILQKARLQAGKKGWGAFNEAALTFQLREAPHLMSIEDIAVDLKIPITKVRERLENYKLFREYLLDSNDDNPKRFAYFAECPPKVKEWFRDSPQHKKEYFKLMSPNSGDFNKLRSVATRGGLRDFAQVLEDPEALKLVLTDPHTSIEEALEIARDNNITKGMPFVKKIAPLAHSLRQVSDDQLEKLRGEPKFRLSLKSLLSACEELIGKLGS